MKILGGIILVVLTLVGCAPSEKSSPEEEAEFQRLSAGALFLQQSMRDPESLVFESAMVIKETDAACYEYRARNGFGGMTSGRAVQVGKTFLTNEMAGFTKIWNKNCANRSGREKGHLMKYVLR